MKYLYPLYMKFNIWYKKLLKNNPLYLSYNIRISEKFQYYRDINLTAKKLEVEFVSNYWWDEFWLLDRTCSVRCNRQIDGWTFKLIAFNSNHFNVAGILTDYRANLSSTHIFLSAKIHPIQFLLHFDGKN